MIILGKRLSDTDKHSNRGIYVPVQGGEHLKNLDIIRDLKFPCTILHHLMDDTSSHSYSVFVTRNVYTDSRYESFFVFFMIDEID